MAHDTTTLLRNRARGAILLACTSIALVATGCYKATFIAPKTAAGVEHDEWTDFFVFGLVGDEARAVSEYCEGPVARVRTGSNFGTGLVSVITLGIYTPHKIYVTCADPSATEALASSAEQEVAP
jgi:hypothetical protein